MELNMKPYNQKGFTLIELLIAVALSGLVTATLIGFFISQQRSHTSQEQVTFMQQNMRAGLGIMSKELRMAGYNPTNQTTVAMGFSAPGEDSITFTLDFHGLETDGIDNDGDTVIDEADEYLPDGDANDLNEQIVYGFDAATFELRRNGVALAEGIDALGFAFFYDSDADGVIDGNAAIAGVDGNGPLDGTVNWYQVDDVGNAVDTGTLALAADIRAVRIWLLARTDAPDPQYTNNNDYYVGSQSFNFGDPRRRRLIDTAVLCRNMGLL